jgi:hypothetical protein
MTIVFFAGMIWVIAFPERRIAASKEYEEKLNKE